MICRQITVSGDSFQRAFTFFLMCPLRGDSLDLCPLELLLHLFLRVFPGLHANLKRHLAGQLWLYSGRHSGTLSPLLCLPVHQMLPWLSLPLYFAKDSFSRRLSYTSLFQPHLPTPRHSLTLTNFLFRAFYSALSATGLPFTCLMWMFIVTLSSYFAE